MALFYAVVRQCGAGLLRSCLMSVLLCGMALAENLPDAISFGHAIDLNQQEKLQTWWQQGLSVEFCDERGNTGLMRAAWEGNLALVKQFVQAGAQINRRNDKQETAIMLAAWRGHESVVTLLLQHQADIDQNGRGWTPLMYAAFAGHSEIVERLLFAGADINAPMINGSTALMMAAREGHVSIVGRLLAAGARMEMQNDYGDDVIAWAKKYQQNAVLGMLGMGAEVLIVDGDLNAARRAAGRGGSNELPVEHQVQPATVHPALPLSANEETLSVAPSPVGLPAQ